MKNICLLSILFLLYLIPETHAQNFARANQLAGSGSGSGAVVLAIKADAVGTAFNQTVVFPLSITALSPARNDLATPANANVGIAFNQPLSTAPESLTTLRVFSRQRGGLLRNGQGGITTVTSNSLTFDPTANFQPGETPMITVLNTLQSSDGTSLGQGQVHQFTVGTDGTGRGNFTAHPVTATLAVGDNPSGLVLGDINGDGYPDLITANFDSDNLSVLLNNGTGVFSLQATIAVGDGPQSVALGDIDADGDLDLLAVNVSNDNVSVLLNNGAGVFTPHTTPTVAVGDSPRNVALGDVDADGDLDLVTANFGSGNNVSVRLNNGTGSFTNHPTSPVVGSDPSSVALGDLDGDGDLDLVTTNLNSDNLSVLLNNGTGSFTNHPTSPTVTLGDGPQGVVLGDFDGDGDLDLAAINTSNNTVPVLLNDGAGNLTPHPTRPLPQVNQTPRGLALGDVDRDGDLDLITVSQADRVATVLLNNGTGSFTNHPYNLSLRVGNVPRGDVLGDIDGDGDLDLIAINGNDDNISVFLNQPPLLGLAASTSSVCTGGLVTFTATVNNVSIAYTFTLTNGTATVTGTRSTTAFSQNWTTTGSGPQTFTLTVVYSGTISRSATTTLTVLALPSLTITANPSLTITNGQTTTLTASGADSYTWTGGTNSLTLSVSTAGAYSVTGNTAGCLNTTSVLVSTILPCNAIIYVSQSGSGVQDGSSWANAVPGTRLQTAIDQAALCGGGQVWVARGTYKPTSNTDRTVSFQMRNNVAVYGGFVGSETALSGRPALNPVTADGGPGQPSSSTLSGEIGNPAIMTDNSQTIVYHPEGLSLNSSAMLDGFVLTRGNGSPGGGMWNEPGNSPTVRNCLFVDNLGGGMYNLGSSPALTDCSFQSNTTSLGGGGIYNQNGSSPSLTNCLFERNEAEHGGGVWNFGNSNPTLTNCTFRYNRVVSGSGGGLYNQDNSNATVTNCVFLSNSASSGGGGMRNINSTVSITNCTIQGNTAPYGGGMQHENTNLTLTNCLFRANSATSGGGIYADQVALRVVNTSFESNSSEDYGGAISADGSTTLTNCSFQSNSANSTGIYGAVIQSAATFINCVEFGNQTGKAFTDDITATYSLFAPSSYTEVAISGTNNLTAIGTPTAVSPFASTTSTQLAPCSPAIDTGDPSTTSATVGDTDLAGNARFFAGGRVDVGAYESAGTSLFISASTATPVVCQGNRIQFTGSGGGIYSWSGPQSLTQTGSSFSLFDVQPNQSGTYTLVVTDANSCTASATVSVTVNPAPATPAIVRSVGDDVCGGSSVTLSVVPAPNVTYVWERGMVASEDETFTSFGSGTAIMATQGGIYRYIATSTQTSCSALMATDLFLGDYRYVGSIDSNDPTQLNRFDRTGYPSTCAVPKVFDLDVDGNIRYDAYTIVNPRPVPVCATIGTRQACNFQIQSAAYLGSFNPASVSANYAGDGGATWDEPGFYEITIPANGTAIVVVHGSGPSATCSSYTLVVDIPREAAGLTVSPATGTVCPGTTLTLTASTANTYAWNGSSLTTASISTTPTATTAYAVTLGYGNRGCSATATSGTITVGQLNPTLMASNSLNCSMTSATLSASATGSGSLTYTFLSTSGSLPGSPSINSTVTINQGGSYSVLVTGATGCTALQSTTVFSNTATPTAGLVASGTITCAVPTVTLTASGGGNYSFNGPVGGPTGIVSTSGNLATVNLGGTYSVTVLNPANGCFATSTVSVSSDLGGASAAPTLSASSSVVCVGSNVQVVATVGGSPLQWYRNGSPVSGQTSATLTLDGVQVTQAGSYALVMAGGTDSRACSVTSASFSLTVNPLPAVTLLVPNNASVQGATITLPAPLTGVNFQATGGTQYERLIVVDRVNGFEIRQVDSNTNGVFLINRTGPFRLTVTDGNGCKQTVGGVVQTQP